MSAEENPFRKDGEVTSQPLAANPYVPAKPLKTIVTIDVPQKPFERKDFQKGGDSNPYETPQAFQARTGITMTTMTSQAVSCKERKLPVGGLHRKILDKFSVEIDGIYLVPRNPLTQEPTQLSNFAFSVSELRLKQKRDEEAREEIVVRVTDHEDTPLIIAADEYGNRLIDEILKKYPDCCLIGAASGMARGLLREFAAAIYGEARRSMAFRRIYAYHGWAKVDGKMTYLSASRPDCECSCTIPKVAATEVAAIWRQGLHITDIGRRVFKADGKLDDVATYKVSLPFFLYLHLSFSCKLFMDAGLNVQFLLLLVGKTGSLKTTICQVFAEPFNPGGMLRLESTPRALELYREASMDMTMLADDIFAQKGAIMAKFEDILRAFGDSIGRAKSAGTGFNDLVRTKVRGGCIVTAENTLAPQQSSVLRSLSLAMDQDSIDKAILQEFQDDQIQSARVSAHSIVQLYFAAWVGYLEENYSELVGLLSNNQLEPLPLHFKRYEKVRHVLHAVAAFILRWGRQCGAISSEEWTALDQTWRRVIDAVMLENDAAAIIAEPWQQFLLALHQGIGTGTIPLAGDKAEYEAAGGKFIGFPRVDKEGLEYVLAPDQIYAAIKRQMHDAGKELVSEPMIIFRDLFLHGIARGYTNQDGRGGSRNRYLKRLKMHGHLVEMLILSAEDMESAVGNILNGGDMKCDF